MALDWLASGWRERRAPPELLFQALSVVTLEIALRAASAPFSGPLFGQLLFFAQPVIVLFGFAALHRRQPQRA